MYTMSNRLMLGLMVGACTIVYGQQMRAGARSGNGDDLGSEARLRRDAANDRRPNNSSHIHVHFNETMMSTDEKIAYDESAYFVSALFQKYDGSTRLSLDGFVRLLCHLGLIPVRAADGNYEADDSSHAGGCGRLTFDQVPPTFETLEKERIRDHAEGHEAGDHSDEHSDHDHQPNRNASKSSFGRGLGNETDHDHDHDHDHVDHNHDHDHLHSDDHDHHDHDNEKIRSGGNDSSVASQSSGVTTRKVNDKTDNLSDDDDKNDGNPVRSRRMKRHFESSSEVSESSASTTMDPQGTVHRHPIHLSECISPAELLKFFHIPSTTLDIDQFTLLCPALLFKLDAGICKRSDDHHVHDHDHDHDHDHHHEADGGEEVKQSLFSAMSAKVWGYSTAAVLVISLAGLLGVAVIPIMQKVFYNHLLQFLVAIAVGALSGDALLHLLPHAIAENQSHDSHDHAEEESHEHNHLKSVWKGLIALICIFFFFLVERILTIVTEKKRRKKAMSRLKKKRCERLCDAEKSSKVGAKLSAHETGDYADCEQMVMVVHPNRALKGYADATHDVVMHQCDESLSQAEQNFTDDDGGSHAALEHSHGHGHGHSHFGSVPGSVAAVAWMVIFGDGIHNFSDGLAIGAAFANSVTGGISTSIAVFCHELPHEIGDFAVLLRAGMSVKQAIVYNCVSSVLCFIGMLVGVAIGNIQDASLWIFAGVGGMFIYISMVDMLPEMTAVDTKKGENHFLHLLLQVCGMMIGAGIMLLIAVFEHDLQQLVD